jgi:hypothetical protein
LVDKAKRTQRTTPDHDENVHMKRENGPENARFEQTVKLERKEHCGEHLAHHDEDVHMKRENGRRNTAWKKGGDAG